MHLHAVARVYRGVPSSSAGILPTKERHVVDRKHCGSASLVVALTLIVRWFDGSKPAESRTTLIKSNGMGSKDIVRKSNNNTQKKGSPGNISLFDIPNRSSVEE